MKETPRPTIRSLAKQAGVTPMTVSLALRNHASISRATKERIQRLAAESGYRPDPEVSKLMHHLRTRREVRYQATICGLRSRPNTTEARYGDEIEQGAKERAGALGFGFESLWLEEVDRESRSLHRILRSRGIEGLVLLPMAKPVSLANAVQWSDFSVVTASLSVLAPRFSGVIPDQFGNMMKLCSHLSAEGYRRLGLVTQPLHDLRVDHRFTGALAWHGVFGRVDSLKPFVTESWPPDRKELQQWYRAQKPQVLIADSESRARSLQEMLAPIATPLPPMYSTGLCSEESHYPGINEHPQEIGAVAVDMLAGQLQRGIKGVPKVSSLTMIEGSLVAKAAGEAA